MSGILFSLDHIYFTYSILSFNKERFNDCSYSSVSSML